MGKVAQSYREPLMHVVEHADPDGFSRRSHPWHGSLTDPTHQYHDLKKHPELIRSSLEDFTPWAAYPATETFYQLLEWVNGPASMLETNDCAFTGPTANEMAQFPAALQCSGRVMLLFRQLTKNQDKKRVGRLTEALARGLSAQDEGFEMGVIGATIVPVRLTPLPGTEDEQLGSQLMLSFWAWGDDPVQTLANLDRTLSNLSVVLQSVAASKSRRGRGRGSKASSRR
jgi:hypothetical protein